MTLPSGMPDRRAVAHVMRDLKKSIDEADAGSPHAIIVCDPSTSTRHTVGPYPDRIMAKLAVIFMRERNIKADPELANLVYEVVLSFTPEEA